MDGALKILAVGIVMVAIAVSFGNKNIKTTLQFSTETFDNTKRDEHN